MATARLLRRSPIIPQPLRLQSRLCSTSSTPSPRPQPQRRHPPPRPHEFSKPSDFLGSCDPPANPREAEDRLDRLRKDDAKQMKQVSLERALEMEVLRADKARKAKARREAARIVNKQRKAAATKSLYAQRKALEKQFWQMLIKERAQKEEMRDNKKSESGEEDTKEEMRDNKKSESGEEDT